MRTEPIVSELETDWKLLLSMCRWKTKNPKTDPSLQVIYLIAPRDLTLRALDLVNRLNKDSFSGVRSRLNGRSSSVSIKPLACSRDFRQPDRSYRPDDFDSKEKRLTNNRNDSHNLSRSPN